MNPFFTALELSLISSLTVLSLFLSYRMLNVCDLSTDSCFTLGAAVGAVVVLSGHPFLALPASMCAGAVSGLITSLLQTYMGVPSLLAGIVVNTGLYSVNIAIMHGSSLLNLNRADTVFTKVRHLFSDTFLFFHSNLITILIIVFFAIIFVCFFLKTRLGLAIRATGNNEKMVRSSSVNPAFTTIICLCISNSFTALSGCLLAMYQRSANITMGSGMVTIALASLLIGNVFFSKTSNIFIKSLSVFIGSFLFRLVYTLALRLHMKAFMLKLVSSIIVVIFISVPYIQKKLPELKKRIRTRGRNV